MVQGQSQYAGEKKEDREIWFTYHALALRATRKALEQHQCLRVRDKETDKTLACVQNSRPPCFSKSIIAIVMCVFLIEYRMNAAAQREGIQQNQRVRLYRKYDADTVDLCISYDKEKERTCCNEEEKFECVILFEKWLNIERILKNKDTDEFLHSVRKLHKWIWIRNKIAHGDYEKILKIQIFPKEALSCYDDVTNAIFGLNTVLGYGTKKENKQTCERMLLRQKNISP